MATLANKYRPKTFEDMVEQPYVVQILENICNQDNLTNRNFLLIGPAGTGKAQPMYSQIQTPNGPIFMGDVEIGDEVYTGSGNVTKVEAIYDQGSRSIYEIELSDGECIHVADNHLNEVWIGLKRRHVIINTLDLINQFKLYSSDVHFYIELPELLDIDGFTGVAYHETRYITKINYIGMQECRCIQVESEEHTYLSDGYIPTHNTTLGRIVANKLNDNKGEPIEIDAASHSGVDSMREIVQQAQQYPIGTKYKVFIIDECFSGDVKVLTDNGFKAFKELDKTEKIAQYNDDMSIEFVTPLNYVKRYHSGSMVKFYPKYGDSYVLMTPGHNQYLYDLSKDSFRLDAIDDIELSKNDRAVLSGRGAGEDIQLSSRDILMLFLSAYATLVDNRYVFYLDNIRCDVDGLKLLTESDFDYDIEVDALGTRVVKLRECYENPIDLFQEIPLESMNYSKAEKIIECTLIWFGVDDLTFCVDNPLDAYYSTRNKNLFEFVSCVATLAGYSVQEKIYNYDDKGPHITDYLLHLDRCNINSVMNVKKEYTSFEGMVYCVEVPSHKIIVQANGFTFVTGNCHSLSNAAWQSALKCLEESPAMSVMCFCTTNPEKIPATILSRVQTFQLSKISLDGICNRLKYVIDNENKEGRDIKYDESSLNFLAKLANGGMRDALTSLDKILAYSNVIDSDSISRALNLPNYDDYFSLLNAYAKKDNKGIAELVDHVYNSGVNFVKWFEGFHSFIMNVVKYIFLQDIESTMIPAHYKDKISKYGPKHSAVCLKLANKLLEMNNVLKSTPYLQEIALTYLCSVPKKEKAS